MNDLLDPQKVKKTFMIKNKHLFNKKGDQKLEESQDSLKSEMKTPKGLGKYGKTEREQLYIINDLKAHVTAPGDFLIGGEYSGEETPRKPREPFWFLEYGLLSTKSLKNYDVWDEMISPEEWIEKCKNSPPPHAKSPVYVDKKYTWVPVEVLSFDQEKKKYYVKVLENSQRKYVGRLSLLFNEEDPEAFQRRLDLCKDLQLTAEDELRFLKYVDSHENGLVSSLPREVFNFLLISELQ